MGVNKKYLRRLVKEMYAIRDFPELDKYGAGIFERPIKGTWKLFRHIARRAVADIWKWSPDKERASYPKKAYVPTFDEFATFMLHEVAHGWHHFLEDDLSLQNYSTGVDEEQICWNVSNIVCKRLGIVYKKDLADLCYQFHCFAQANNIRGVKRILKKMPQHLKL